MKTRKSIKKSVATLIAMALCMGLLPGGLSIPYASATGVQVATFAALQAAIDAAPISAPGNTTTFDIEITASIQLESELWIATGKNIKIWSTSPYTLKAADNANSYYSSMFYVVGGTLTLENYVTFEGTGDIGSGLSPGNGVNVGGDGTFLMDGGRISNCYLGVAVCIYFTWWHIYYE
jgi:hypothetical protein